jgi:pSer/pThr/pTyr-binding forkhead associated (FHA) protein
MAPKLEVTRGENIGETYKVTLTTRIGRERDNDIVLLDPKVSRYHAQITLENGQWTITDLGSANLTYLEGAPITEPTPLRDGERIGLGELEFTFRMPVRPGDEAEVPRRAKAPTMVTPTAAPAGDASPVKQTEQRIPSRLVWIAGGFILLLALVVLAIFAYALFNRTPAEETVTTEATASVVADSESSRETELPEGVLPPGELTLIYEDDFSDSFGGWDDAFDAYTTKQYGNNRYQIEVTASNLVAWGLANRDVADFELQVEVRREDGVESNSYGLLFRFQDRDNFYRFDVSGDGYFLLSKFVDGEWETLVDWTEAPNLNTELGVDNILKVSAFGPDITVWANGQPLATVQDDSLPHGNFGFFASTFSEPYIWISYDNLKMWAPKGEERAITLIPTATRPSAPLPTPTSLPTSTLAPTNTPTIEPEPEATETEPAAEATPTPTLTATTPPTATPEPTATPVPLPEYASRDQTLARGESRVAGRIVFPVYDPERATYDIYIANAADGGNRELVQENASQPAVSEDGTDIAYRSWQPDKRGLFARLLSGGDAWGFDLFFESARPQFSPIDKSLMYHSRTGGQEPAIYRVIDGIGEVMRRDGFPIQGESAKWSPDGQQFVYNSCVGSKCGVIRSNIDSTNPVILSDHPTDTNPEVSPNGSQVVFMSKRSGDWEVYLVGIDGGNITALTSDDASNGLPTWSPEGDKIAFVSNRDGEWSVWDMDPDGSNQRRLFTTGGPVDGIVQHDPTNSRGWTEENIVWIP